MYKYLNPYSSTGYFFQFLHLPRSASALPSCEIPMPSCFTYTVSYLKITDEYQNKIIGKKAIKSLENDNFLVTVSSENTIIFTFGKLLMHDQC